MVFDSILQQSYKPVDAQMGAIQDSPLKKGVRGLCKAFLMYWSTPIGQLAVSTTP